MPRDPRDIGLRKPERESRRLAEAAEDARLGSYPRGGSSGEAGPEGPAGEKGAEGKEGPPGAPGESGSFIVYHGTNAAEPRPETADEVFWVGTVEPENAAEHDLWINPSEAGVDTGHDWGIVEALPEGASKGDRCTYKAATGVYWELINTEEETYPWAKIGGPALYAFVAASVEIKNTSFEAKTGGPELTTPLKGDYMVEIGAEMNNSGAGNATQMSYKVGGTAAAAEDRALVSGGWQASASSRRKKAGLAATTAIVAHYAVATGTGFASVRYMTIDPLRVG